MENQSELMLQFCKAMADESRLKMIGQLSAGECSVQQLATMLDLREPTVSHHLAILKQLDLVKMRADGNFRWYCLNEEVLGKISRTVFRPENIARLATAAEPKASRADRKILANFVEGERLLEIPVSRTKRLVILKWLASFFERGISYSEAEVNAILKRHHQDCATLRREMIGYRILAREKGIYRKVAESDWRDGVN